MMKRLIFLSIISIIVILLAYLIWHHFEKTKPKAQIPAITVLVAKATIKTVPEEIHAIGQAIAPETTILKNQTAGTVTKIFFHSGEFVKKGQILLQIDPSQAQALVAQKFANYSNFHEQYQRYLKLSKLDKGDVTANQLAQVKNNMLADEAAWEYAKKQLDHTQVRAPFSGIIGRPQAILNQISLGGNSVNVNAPLSEGSYLAVGAPIAILTKTSKILVQYQVPEVYSSKLTLGQPVMVHFLAYPNKTFKGKVTYISPIVYQNTQSYIVQAKIDNSQHLLRSGMDANIVQTLNPNRKILTIPGMALTPSLTGYSVYTVVDSKVEALPVSIGGRYKSWVTIESGLKPGQKIIIGNTLILHPGMKVKVKNS